MSSHVFTPPNINYRDISSPLVACATSSHSFGSASPNTPDKGASFLPPHTLKEVVSLPQCPYLHFVAIGGIGMSTLAHMALDLGWRVRGSDRGTSFLLQALKDRGIPVYHGHGLQALGIDVDACAHSETPESKPSSETPDALVVSSAIPLDNPELVWARENGIPIMHRSDLLRYFLGHFQPKKIVALGGAHGKTSTSALLWHLLRGACPETLGIIGGLMIDADASCSFRQGSQRLAPEFCVVEADESDGSHTTLGPIWGAIITNVTPDHLGFYAGDQEAFMTSFRQFAAQVQDRGRILVCADDASLVQWMRDLPEVQADGVKKWRTYGIHEHADIRIEDIGTWKGGMSFTLRGPMGLWPDIKIPLWGHHNVLNACAAITMAHDLGLSRACIEAQLATFPGVKRRLQCLGRTPQGTMIVEDYAHHPKEIAASLEALTCAGHDRILAIIEPYRHKRLKENFQDFVHCAQGASGVILLPVRGAFGQEIAGASSHALMLAIKEAYPQLPLWHLSYEDCGARPQEDDEDTIKCFAPSVSAIIKDFTPQVVVGMGIGSVGRLMRILAEDMTSEEDLSSHKK